MGLLCLLMEQDEEEQTRRQVWETYTANALGTICQASGVAVDLYSTIISGQQKKEEEETATGIVNRLLRR